MAKAPTSKIKKEYKLDLFRTLNAIDTRQRDFFDKLNQEEKKAYAPLVTMRWISSCVDQSGYHEAYLHVVNEMVNQDFWRFSKEHQEFQHILLATCGMGVKVRHEWIPMCKNFKVGKLAEFLLQAFPGANALETHVIIQKHSVQDFQELVKTYGYDKNEEKEIVDQFKKVKIDANHD